MGFIWIDKIIGFIIITGMFWMIYKMAEYQDKVKDCHQEYKCKHPDFPEWSKK